MTIFDYFATSAKQAELLDRVKRLQAMSADILAAQGMIGAQLHELASEQMSQRTEQEQQRALMELILERLTPPSGPDPQQEEVDALVVRLINLRERSNAALAAYTPPQ